jgi:pyruvate formate lyase activating enzyme
MHEALHYMVRDEGSVQCLLCPHRCILDPDQHGRCNTRVNREGKLITESYGILSSISSDPVEKKPLYHFFPGKPILSIGGFGCNLSCDFCQNCEISQIDHRVFSHHPMREPEDIVNKAILFNDNIGLAYTYNEPTVYYEYMVRCAALIKEKRHHNVMVTNGYINSEPLDELIPHMDAFNVDLKSFRDEFYASRSSASLQPVLDTISRIARSDKHLEITFLIIPGCNDSESEWKDMIRWIHDHCGSDTILHVSRYFPRYKLNKPPTPLQTIQRFLDLASDRFRYVYPGNTPQLESHTYCPVCGAMLIQRNLYQTAVLGMNKEGCCQQCDTKIPGVFNNDKT